MSICKSHVSPALTLSSCICDTISFVFKSLLAVTVQQLRVVYLGWHQTSDRLNLQGELRREIIAYPSADHLENSLLLHSWYRSASTLVHEGKRKPILTVPKSIILSSTGTKFWSTLVTVQQGVKRIDSSPFLLFKFVFLIWFGIFCDGAASHP